MDYLLVKGETSKVVMNFDCKEVSSGGVVNGYVAPDVVLVHFTQRGVLCQSLTGNGHEDFTEGGSWEL